MELSLHTKLTIAVAPEKKGKEKDFFFNVVKGDIKCTCKIAFSEGSM